MDIFAFNAAELLSFLLTLIRVSLVVFLLPFYGGEYIPPLVKGALCLVLTMALWPHLSFPGALMPSHPFTVGLMIAAELLFGMLLGLCVYFIFAGIQTGGELMGFQMGFTMMTLADPTTGAQVSITSHLLYMVTLIAFLVMDGHLHLLKALSHSFALVPPGGLRFGGPLTWDVISFSGQMFSLAIKIAAPVIAALFMVELTLALMGRAAPQMNLLTLGFPAKIGVGFYFIGLLMSTLVNHMEDIILDLGPMFERIMGMTR